MKQIEVFDGNKLRTDPVPYPTRNARCAFIGTNAVGGDTYVPLDADLLSRHIMFLGGIGTGKTNAFFQIMRQLRGSMTGEDVMIIFDTKGDFAREMWSSVMMKPRQARQIRIIGISSMRSSWMSIWKKILSRSVRRFFTVRLRGLTSLFSRMQLKICSVRS